MPDRYFSRQVKNIPYFCRHKTEEKTKEMERILVIGGAGFISSHLCERLVREGNDMICLENYFTGNKNNIRHLLGNDRFEAVRHDVTTQTNKRILS